MFSLRKTVRKLSEKYKEAVTTDWTPELLKELRKKLPAWKANYQDILDKHPETATGKDADGVTPLMEAAKQDLSDFASQLIDHHAPADAKDKAGRTAMHYAAMEGNGFRVIGVLRSAGGDINAVDNDKRTPLHYAVLSDSVYCVRNLVGEGADLEARDSKGETPLQLAQRLKSRISLQNELKPQEKTAAAPVDWTAALLNELRSRGRSVKYGEILTQHPEAVSGQDADGITPLMEAARTHPWALPGLIDRRAPVAAVDKEGRTAVHYAALGGGGRAVVEVLRAAGADINAADNEKRTPLHYAVTANNAPVIAGLVAAGADLAAKDANGETPPQLAERLKSRLSVEAALKPNPPKEVASAAALAVPQLTVQELTEIKDALKAAFKKVTAPDATADALTVATTAQALLTVDARLKDAGKGPKA